MSLNDQGFSLDTRGTDYDQSGGFVDNGMPSSLTEKSLPLQSIVPQAGDQLVRIVPYDGVQHSAVILSNQLESATDLAARGVPLESTAPGGYVEVRDVLPDGGQRIIGRRLTDATGRMLRGQNLMRSGQSMSEAMDLAGSEEVYEDKDYPVDQTDVLGLAEQSVSQINWCQMRQTISTTALTEERRWTSAGGAKYQESNHPQRLPILRAYWQVVPGFTSQANASSRATQSINNQVAWSAAFISYVMHTAGIRQQHGFEHSQRHITYIVGALRNRERSDQNRPFWLVDEVELQREAVPQNGDIICFNRMSNGSMTTHSYSSLRNAYWSGGHQNVVATGSSHTSIVTGRGVQNGQHFIEVIGGNENHSVRLRRFPTDQWGGIPNPQAHNIFGMIKIMRC